MMQGAALPWDFAGCEAAHADAHNPAAYCGKIFGSKKAAAKRRRGGVLTGGGYAKIKRKRAMGGALMRGGRGHPFLAAHQKGQQWYIAGPQPGYELYSRTGRGRVHYDSRAAYGQRLRAGQGTPMQRAHKNALQQALGGTAGQWANKADYMRAFNAFNQQWNSLSPQEKLQYARAA